MSQCGEIQTIQHCLLYCPRYVISRYKLFCNLTKLGLNEGGSFSPNKERILMLALFAYFNNTDKLNVL